MNKRNLLFTIIITFMFISSMNVSVAQTSEDTCEEPSEQISITGDPNVDGSLEFDKTEMRVTKGACVEITFYNKSPVIEHDFTIDADDSISFKGAKIHLFNNKDGVNGTDHKSILVQMPDVDVTLEFYCQITGHRDGGMFGDFIIGEGSPAPGFGIPITILGFFALIAIPRLRKRN